METVKEKQKKSIGIFKNSLGITNPMAAPRVLKVVVSVGTGKSSRKDRQKNDFVIGRLAKITGQKPALRGAKKSIAAFKLREKEPIGVMVTLRGKRMYDFLDRLLNIAIPRMRDFRGFERKSVDAMGNLTLGIREHNIFPETSGEELKDVFGLAVTIVTSAKTREEAIRFFEAIGVKFKQIVS